MINIHLNGDIVRCPDIAAIQLRAKEIREKHRICKYNIHEDTCQTWQQSLMNWQNVKNNNNCGSCMLSGSMVCPGHIRQTETGNKEKSFRIDNVNYRKLSSSAHYLVMKSKFKTLFITLTFPKFKIKYNEKQLNECFSRYMENLRKNYNCSGYVAVRERGKNNTHRYHYHVLCSIPFVPFADLNNAWNSAISDICFPSKRSVTSDKKTLFIRNPVRALRYVCKYFAKSKGQSSKSRIIFISNDLVRKPIHFDNENCEYYTINDLLDSFKSVTRTETSDYSTAFRINDSKEFGIFCERILYKFFNLPDKMSSLYSFHPG